MRRRLHQRQDGYRTEIRNGDQVEISTSADARHRRLGSRLSSPARRVRGYAAMYVVLTGGRNSLALGCGDVDRAFRDVGAREDQEHAEAAVGV